MRPACLAEVVRGTWVESLHHGWAVLVDGEGQVQEALGEQALVFARSSLKPLQAMPLLSSGAADRLLFTDEELAMACSSHSGTERHVALVRAMLAKAGVAAHLLRCGAHPPLHEPAAERMRLACEPASALHNNCSGKHAAMLAVCKVKGWDLETYDQPDHPLQRAIRGAIARFAGLEASSLQAGIDGCGVPAWRLPLESLAQALSRMTRDASGARLLAAMARYPELVAGPERFDTRLMTAAGGRLVAKAGAEALHVGVELATGRAWAVKVADGNRRAIPPIVVSLLRRHQVLRPEEVAALGDQLEPNLTNHAGTTVGYLRAVLDPR